MRRKLIQGMLIGLAAAGAAMLPHALGWLEWLENGTWDWRVRAMARRGAATDQIRLIFLDQGSLDWGRATGLSWPWPRQVYAPIIEFCQQGGAKAVAFDAVFTEPSYKGVEDDQQLGSAIAACAGFVGSVFLSAEQGSVSNWPAGMPFQGETAGGLAAYLASPAGRLTAMPGAVFNVPEIATNCRTMGNVHGSLEPDATIRRANPFETFAGRLVPALGIAAYLAANPGTPLALAPGELRVGSRAVPLDRRGRAILRYRGRSQSHPTVSAQAVLQSYIRLSEGGQPVLQPSFFTNCYVLLGFTAPALMDLKASPVSRVYPGVEVHATLLDNLLAGDFPRDAPPPLHALLILAVALTASLGVRLGGTPARTVVAFAILLPLPLAFGFAGYAAGFWLPVAPGTLAAGLALTGAVVTNYATEGRQKRFIKSAFKQYLSPAVIDRLVHDPGSLKLGGELRELSIHFSDVKGFSTISESLKPDRLTALLNEYLTAMSDIVMEEGGTVDKYEGDAIIAFWNAPLDLPGHATCAVRAALRCQRKLAEMRPDLNARYGHELYCRVGINTGAVVIGNMGSHQRFNYTFLGDAGNLASRLEGVNKQFGTAILVSEFTRTQLAADIAVREIGRVRVVGKNEPVRVYEPYLPDDAARRAAAFAVFAEGLAAYYAGRFAEAAQVFDRVAAEDGPARSYAARCRDLAAAPPADWDGVWVMKEK